MANKEPGYVYILTNPSFREDWSYDTLKRCRFFYQTYENVVIGTTTLTLPQLEKQEVIFAKN